jgi:hypothetical protein
MFTVIPDSTSYGMKPDRFTPTIDGDGPPLWSSG